MARKLVIERQWKQIAPLLPDKSFGPGCTRYDNSAVLEGILWVMRTRLPFVKLAGWFLITRKSKQSKQPAL